MQWRKDIEGFKNRCKQLVAKARAEFDGHIKVPHPDTDPEERAKALEKIKELNKPMDLYDDFDDFAEEDQEDYEDEDYGDGEDFSDGDEGDMDEEDEEEDD